MTRSHGRRRRRRSRRTSFDQTRDATVQDSARLGGVCSFSYIYVPFEKVWLLAASRCIIAIRNLTKGGSFLDSAVESEIYIFTRSLKQNVVGRLMRELKVIRRTELSFRRGRVATITGLRR